MKITVIGAGNVGSLTALRLTLERLGGEVILFDVVKGLAKAKAFDLEDARQAIGVDYGITGTDDIADTKNSEIVVVTAGLPRKPGMTREELLNKNASIVKEVSLSIKSLSPQAIVVVVSNPLDLMTRLAFETTGFRKERVLGMGLSLDGSRFANIISKELCIPVTDITTCVIGSHGEGMMPLPRLTMVKGVALDEIIDDAKSAGLVRRTVERGHEIVTLLGNGSAYFAPSAAIAILVRAIAKDTKQIIGVCTQLEGEYGIKGVSLGLPCRIGRGGAENIIELDLKPHERNGLLETAAKLKEQYQKIALA